MSAGRLVQITTSSGTSYKFPLASHRWEVYSGYKAKVQAWLVPRMFADELVKDLAGLEGADREVTIALGDADDPAIFERIVVLGIAPADNPQKRYLLLTDVRWYLESEIAVWDVNVRRRVGDRRLVGDSFATETPVDTVAYALWSINKKTGDKAFTWEDYRDQAITFLTLERHGRPHVSFEVDHFDVLDVSTQIVQEGSTDSDGPAALARAIESIPGAGVYVDSLGVLRVFERTPGAEDSIMSQLPKRLMGHGDAILQDNSALRPVPSDTSYRIYVDYEVEVAFRYDPAATRGKNDPYLIPVLQVTDQQLTIPAGTYSGVTRATDTIVGQGTWISQDEAFKAWGSPVRGSITLPQLTDELVADCWIGDGLNVYTLNATMDNVDPVWAARIGELMRCYRTFFKVNPGFWDRVRRAWTVRAVVWDPTTSTRAPSPVYSNYHLTPLDEHGNPALREWGFDVPGSYPSSGNLAADGKPSGFRVSIEDDELGIVAIARDLTRFPGHTQIAPSPVITRAKLVGGSPLFEPSLQQLQHSPDWKLAIIMSCAPGSPNDLGRMYEIQVSQDEAAETAGLSGYVATGHAPDQEIRSQLADARIAWRDEDAQDILAIFGADDAGGEISDDEAVNSNDDTSIVPINLDLELRPLAKSIAATRLLETLDCWQGTVAVPIDGATGVVDQLVPKGSIERVTYKLEKGRFVAVIDCTQATPAFHASDFLTGAARSFLLKEIASQR